jgi:hypothetical protein
LSTTIDIAGSSARAGCPDGPPHMYIHIYIHTYMFDSYLAMSENLNIGELQNIKTQIRG